ncbi:MAG: hypothetical protein ACFFAO_16505 [Candidatus Hermodarchaeota archaeon]
MDKNTSVQLIREKFLVIIRLPPLGTDELILLCKDVIRLPDLEIILVEKLHFP